MRLKSWVSLLLTFGIVSMLLLSGPVQALKLYLQSDKQEYTSTDSVLFTIGVDLEDQDDWTAGRILLKITGPDYVKECYFTPAGTPISGCDNLNIVPLETYGYGYDNYGYGYDDYGYNYGYDAYGYDTYGYVNYGYGYYGYNVDAEFQYEITWAVSNEEALSGNYRADVSVFTSSNDNAAFTSDKPISFKILTDDKDSSNASDETPTESSMKIQKSIATSTPSEEPAVLHEVDAEQLSQPTYFEIIEDNTTENETGPIEETTEETINETIEEAFNSTANETANETAEPEACVPTTSCSGWTDCEDSKQTRTCKDSCTGRKTTEEKKCRTITGVLPGPSVISKFWDDIKAGSKVTFTLAAPESTIESIQLFFKNDATQAGIALTSRAPDNNLAETYQYFEIAKYNFANGDLNEVKIDFKVAKSWSTGRGDIYLFRLQKDTWQELPTELTRSDSVYSYYTATTPGFSYFAISTHKQPAVDIAAPVAKAAMSQPLNDVVLEAQAETDNKITGAVVAQPTDGKGWLSIIAITLVVLLTLVSHYYYRRSHPRDFNDFLDREITRQRDFKE